MFQNCFLNAFLYTFDVWTGLSLSIVSLNWVYDVTQNSKYYYDFELLLKDCTMFYNSKSLFVKLRSILIYYIIFIYYIYLTLHTFAFSHITSRVVPVHISIARNRYFKNCLMADLCFHRFVHFGCVSVYIFGFENKQCASDQKDFTFVRFISPMLNSADEPLKDKTLVLML